MLGVTAEDAMDEGKKTSCFKCFSKIFKLKLYIAALFHFKLDEGFRL